MVDRMLLEKKKKLQETRNMLKKLDGVEILYVYEECNDSKLKIIADSLWNHTFTEYYSNTKSPDSKIRMDSGNLDIYKWIKEVTKLKTNQIVFLFYNGVLVKIQIADVDNAIRTMWNRIDERSKGFLILSENMDTLLEVGSDSRDEMHYLFDEYDCRWLFQ